MRIVVLVLLLVGSAVAGASAVLTASDFREQATTLDVELSPTGRYLAVLKNAGNSRVVTVHDLEQNGVQISEFGDDVVRPYNLNWAADDKLLVNINAPVFRGQVKRALKKKHIREIEYASVNRIVVITPGQGGWVEVLGEKSSVGLVGNLGHIQNILPNNPKKIQISAWVDGRLALFEADIESGKGRRVAFGSRSTYAFLSDNNGKPLFRLDYIRSHKEIQVFEYINDDWVKGERIYFDEDNETAEGIDIEDFAGIMEDGSLIYRKRNAVTGYYELYKKKKNGEGVLFRSEPNTDILGVNRNAYSSEVIGYFKVDRDVIVEVALDKKRQASLDVISKHLTKVGLSGYRVKWRKETTPKLIVFANGLDNPGAIFLFDKGAQTLNFFGMSNDFLPMEKLALPARVSYQARDGAKIPSLLLLPPGYEQGKSYPTVVMPHGGPQARDYNRFDPIAQFIATRGYVVIMPNFRGSTGFGRAHEEAGYKEWGGLMQRDVEDAAKYLIRKKVADPDRICILGISYGGYSALMGALNEQRLFKCAVSVNGVTHIPKLLAHSKKEFKDAPVRMSWLYDRVGHPETDKEMLEDRSPALLVDRVQVPILLVGGKEDGRVPFSQQELMRKVLKKAKKEFEFISFKDGVHNPIANYEDIVPFYDGVERFLGKYLQAGGM